jgi:DeoR family transcriptional regulator, suf operon transcriptional repressor
LIAALVRSYAMKSDVKSSLKTGEFSDERLLELMRSRGAISIAEAIEAGGVTATAVRQRLTRLMNQGLVERSTERRGRGRPVHRYTLTEKARRQSGHNYADLSMALWHEIRNLKDAEIRRGLLQRVADSMSEMYRDEVVGSTAESRMNSLKELMADRRIPVEIEARPNLLPVLTVVDCPYPELAAQDRSICAMERMMFADLLQTSVSLSQCRLDGHNCCQFETKVRPSDGVPNVAPIDTMAGLTPASP